MKNVSPWPVIEYTGGKIEKPGIYRGVPMSTYHGDCCPTPSFSSTTLRNVENPDKSLEEVYDGLYINPDAAEQADKEAWIRGRARHMLFLGEAGFREQFVIRPEEAPDGRAWNGNNLSCKQWLAEQAADGKAVLKPDELDHIHGAADKLGKHPTIQAGLLNGLVEHSIFWPDPVTGLWLKARPDVIPTESLMIADYKGAADVSASATRKSITNYGYFQQLALVTEGLYQVTGAVATDHVLVFQKWDRPYSINIKPLDPNAIYRGRQLNRRAVDKLAECLKTDTWPGHADDEVPAGLMDWREKQLAWEDQNGQLPGLVPLEDEPRGYTAPADETV